MDRSYKEDIPKAKQTLQQLKKEFATVDSATNCTALRIEPLLQHVKYLERLLRSAKFVRETARLRRGVVMFHSDLVYLRENIKALRAELKRSEDRRQKTEDRRQKTEVRESGASKSDLRSRDS